MSLRRPLIALALAASMLPFVPSPDGAGAAPAGAARSIDVGRPKLSMRRGLPPIGRQMKRAARTLERPETGETDPASFPAVLQRIAACESGGNPSAVGGGGAYRGLFQFTLGTWRGVGGAGDPVRAPIAEQYRRAAILLARSGPGQWPVCAA